MIRQFDFNPKKYKEELEELTKVENSLQLANNKLTTKSLYAFSELYIALIHLKVMRAFIDGVLRFGIPITFAIAIIKPNPSQDKAILDSLNH
jgi:V-type H+-transporting ATPase subunit C